MLNSSLSKFHLNEDIRRIIIRKTVSNRKQILLLVVCSIGAFVIICRNLKREDHNHEDAAPWWTHSPLWTQGKQPHVNPHPYTFLNNNPEICRRAHQTDLLIMVSSAVDHWEHRAAIRSTWGAQSYLDKFRSRIIFLLGQGNERQSLVNEEAREFRDMIQEDFHDSYHNLTLKTMMGLKWAAIFCPQAKYIMKTDDDIFVNVKNLHKAVVGEFTKDLKIRGCIKNGRNAPQPIPSANQNPSMPNLVFKPGHPEFVAGAGYLIPGKFSADMYISTLTTKFIPVEDAFTTGYCATKLGLHPPHHDVRFSCGQLVERDCDIKDTFTGHRISPERQFTLFQKLQRNVC